MWIGNNKNPYGRKEMKTSYLSLQRDVSDEVTDARGLTGKFSFFVLCDILTP